MAPPNRGTLPTREALTPTPPPGQPLSPPVAPRHPRVPALPDRPRCPPTLPRPPGNARAPPLKGAAPRRGQKGTNRCKIDPVFYLGRGGGCGSAPQGSSTPIPQQCDPMVPSSVCVCVYVQGGLWLKDGALRGAPFLEVVLSARLPLLAPSQPPQRRCTTLGA